MRIPSYDDLTPSIPDISPGDVFTSTAAVLPHAGPVVERPALPATAHQAAGARQRARSPEHSAQRPAPPVLSTRHQAPTPLFAALHGAASDRLVAIARDFSPRIERWPAGSVVLDVAGLQRLLGDAPAIAADLAQSGAPRVAIAASQMAPGMPSG